MGRLAAWLRGIGPDLNGFPSGTGYGVTGILGRANASRYSPWGLVGLLPGGTNSWGVHIRYDMVHEGTGRGAGRGLPRT